MGTLQEQLTAVQARLNSERELGGQKDADKIATLEAQEADLTRQIMEQAQQERVQAQEEKVATITLPYDFNDILSDEEYKNAQGQPHKITVANDMIIELVQEYKRVDYQDHNTEIQTLIDAHKEELRQAKEEIRAAGERELQLKRQNEQLQNSLEAERQQAIIDAKEAVRMEQQVAQLLLDKQDSDSKRDAAVMELDAAKAEINQHKNHIDDLRQQLANAPAPKAAIDIGGTGKLAQLVKESNEAKMNRGLQRWNVMMPELIAPPVLPFLDENSAEVPAEIPSVGESFRTETEVSSGLDSIERGTDQGVSEVTRVEFEELKSRVDILFANQDRSAVKEVA